MEPLTVEAVAAFAEPHFGASDVEQLPSGTWSQAFALTVGSDPLVLRIGGFFDDYGLDQVASGWARPALPVPEVLELGHALDRWFVLTRRVVGTPLDSLDEIGWCAALPSLMEMLVALQTLELPTGGAGPVARDRPLGMTWHQWLLESATNPTDPRLGRWRDAMLAHVGVVNRYDAAVADLDRTVGDCPELRRVVHTDLSGNTFVASGNVSGVFDWGNAVIGDPAYDVAHLTFWAPWHPGCPEPDLRAAAVEVLGDGAGERIRTYELHVALDALRFNAAMGRPRTIEAVLHRMSELDGSA